MKSRRQALQLCLDSAVVVVIQIGKKFLLEVLHGLERLQVKQFTLEQTKKVPHHGIVQTVAFATHALPDALTFEHALVLLVLVLPALVRVENQLRSVWYGFKSLVQHRSYHTQNGPLGDRIAHQIAVVQIQDGREIQFLAEQAEFRHICDPLLAWLFGKEVTVQQVRRDLSDLAFVGAILLHPDTTNQTQLFHKSLDSLVVETDTPAAQGNRNAPVSVSALVFMKDSYDLCLFHFVFVRPLHPLEMIVERRTGQLSD